MGERTEGDDEREDVVVRRRAGDRGRAGNIKI